MKHASDSPGDHLPNHITRILDNPSADPTPQQLSRLRAARQSALAQYAVRAAQPASLHEKLSLWAQRHLVTLRRSGAALGFAAIAAACTMLAEGLLVETESVDATVLSQDLPLDSLLEPHFSRGLHE
ncbi:DUF3619 family protein [Chromobacterium paludis]|uniref:DUF3619 family protein n=1 Tax=Chromobacterium paludis TaxID=2605945 RepID=A0A5C1DJH8_9NEIS|nr:DUF3619 family protein [Chromobacterium paludis]QEL56921.1 DUF3619 family protein [Chromobacterium paludis]